MNIPVKSLSRTYVLNVHPCYHDKVVVRSVAGDDFSPFHTEQVMECVQCGDRIYLEDEKQLEDYEEYDDVG